MKTINANNLMLTSIVCLISVQAAVLLSSLLGLFPPGPGAADRLLAEWAVAVKPKWDLCVYGAFILMTVLGHQSARVLLKDDLKKELWWRGRLKYLSVEAVLTFLMLSAAYKAVIYDNSPFLAQRALAVLAAASLLMKLFWPEIGLISGKLSRRIAALAISPRAYDIFSLVVIAAFIYVPDLERVAAQLFIGEQFHHFDFFLMSPGWAYLNGQLPYVGAISQYGVGVPAVLSRLAFLFGGFDYLPVLKMIMVLVIGYYLLLYGFLRYWLKSIPLALAAFFVAFRLQMFHYGVSPLCWIYPSTTPLRFGLDIVWLGLLLAHLRTGRPLFLVIAGLYSGAAFYYMTSTGACVIGAFYFYLAALWLVPHLRRQYFAAGRQRALIMAGGASVIVSAFVLFWLTLGDHVFSRTFWHNMGEYLDFFSHGHAGGVLPIYESLKYRHFWASLMGFVLPLAYLTAFFFVGTLVYLKKVRNEHFLAVVIAVYGLANYQYYVVRSAVTSYYMNALPFVLLAAFGLAVIARRLDAVWQKRVIWGSLLLSIYALTTNHNYISYPNMFNFSRNPMTDITVAQRYPDRRGYFNHLVKAIKEEDKLPVNSLGDAVEDIRTEDDFKNDQELKEYFHSEFDFTDDAELIRSLTKEGQGVAVLSSFETRVLMQAKRAPFFYHIPLITSQPMRLRAYPADAAHSPNFLKDTLGQLEKDKPEYVFMEKVFLRENIPASYQDGNPNIVAIAQYIRAHYTSVRQGKYLTAMKRK